MWKPLSKPATHGLAALFVAVGTHVMGAHSAQAGDLTFFTSGSKNYVLVAEDELHRISIGAVVGDRLRRIRTFGARGSEPGQLKSPGGAVLDKEGRIWVADTFNDRLQLFTLKGRVIDVIDGVGVVRKPASIARDDADRIYVSEGVDGGRVLVFGPGGGLERVIEPRGGRLGGIAVAPDGHRILVVDRDHRRVIHLDVNGQRLGDTGGAIFFPADVTVTPDGQTYAVTDYVTSVLHLFASTDALQPAGGTGGGDHSPAEGNLFDPQGIAVGPDGNYWVFDNIHHRGQVFDRNGAFVRSFGEEFLGVGDLSPTAVLRHPPTIVAVVPLVLIALYAVRRHRAAVVEP